MVHANFGMHIMLAASIPTFNTPHVAMCVCLSGVHRNGKVCVHVAETCLCAVQTTNLFGINTNNIYVVLVRVRKWSGCESYRTQTVRCYVESWMVVMSENPCEHRISKLGPGMRYVGMCATCTSPTLMIYVCVS